MGEVKRLISAFVTEKEFELKMNMMDSTRSQKETYDIKATKEQMNILTLFVSYGATVNDFEKAFRLLSLKRQDDIAGD